jgi:hypothetical protein
MGTTSGRLLRGTGFLWLIGGVSVIGTVVAGAVTGVGSAIAAAIGVLVALATVGLVLWRAAPNRREAKSSLGTGLLVSVVVAGAVGSAQFAIDDRRTGLENRRAEAVRRAADRQSLRITIGLQSSLIGIDLSEGDLTGFYLAGKDLEAARLDRAVLAGANLERAHLLNARLHKANLHKASLFEADLRDADLSGADLSAANLSGAKLAGADLTGADLRDTRLGADFHGASVPYDLRGVDLAGADFRGADLTEAHLRDANLHGARYDSGTRWPAGFDRAKSGAVDVGGPLKVPATSS